MEWLKQTESMTFVWLSCCQEKWGAFLLLAGLCYHHRARGHSHLLALEIYLIEVSSDWLFTFPATVYKSFKISSQSFAACVHAQLCLTLCNPMDYSPPGSSGHGIFQARIVDWVAIFSSGNLPDPGIKLASLLSPVLTGGFFTSCATWEDHHLWRGSFNWSGWMKPRHWHFPKSSLSSDSNGQPISNTELVQGSHITT